MALCRRQGWCRQDHHLMFACHQLSKVASQFCSSQRTLRITSRMPSAEFGKEATKVNGFDNLSAMEIDPNSSIQEMIEQSVQQRWSYGLDDARLGVCDPGVDEAMGFAEIMKHVKSMEVLCHRLRHRSHWPHSTTIPLLPKRSGKGLAKFSTLGRSLGPMLGQFQSMLGGGGANQEDMFAKLESMREVITEVNTQFKDPEKTTFVLRMHRRIPLAIRNRTPHPGTSTQYEIDTHAIVCNQLLYPKKDSNCQHCRLRKTDAG